LPRCSRKIARGTSQAQKAKAATQLSENWVARKSIGEALKELAKLLKGQ
jgi:hypothetical protein